ncbi:MAG: hypothetical protein L3K19_06130 [Thermoplasmata archaeon]|nr:hypothetical protein [Thermoplasmata archaeon]
MPMLFVRCHVCHEPFPSGVAHNQTERGSLELLGVLEQCPRCGDLSGYVTHEFFFPSDEPAQVDRPTDASVPPPIPATVPATEPGEPDHPHDVGPVIGNRNRPVNVQP